jgi:hypothetical protein
MRELEREFDLPTARGYYGQGNYGTHALMVCVGPLTLYYSYSTIVAYEEPQDGLVVSANVWGPTTGKHLNAISDNKKLRLPRAEFEARLRAMLKRRLGGGA